MKSLGFSLLTALTLASSAVFARETSCLFELNQREQENAPFSPVSKAYAIQETHEKSQLGEISTGRVIRLLERADTEAYSPYDSENSGLYLIIVDKNSCEELWSGRIFGS